MWSGGCTDQPWDDVLACSQAATAEGVQTRGNKQRHGDLDKVVAGAMHPATSGNNLAVLSEVEDARIAGHSAFLGAQEI